MSDDGRSIETYNRGDNDTRAEAVRHWACQFKPGAEVLEIRFGRGATPQPLIDARLRLYLAEISPTRQNRFQQLFPDVAPGGSETSSHTFFSRTFDGVVVFGLTRSMSKALVISLFARVEPVLGAGGRLLVVLSPPSSFSVDFQTVARSSLARGTYETTLWNLGLEVQPQLVDQSGNDYVCAVKYVQAGVPS